MVSMSENQKEIDDIALKLEYLINQKVNSYLSDKNYLEDNVSNFFESLNNKLDIIQDNQEFFIRENLTINNIEAEGYIRAILDVIQLVKDYNLIS